MVIKTPQRHEFPLSSKDLGDGTHAIPEWEISVNQKDDIAWSIVLSYLRSTNFRSLGDFKRRLESLTGSDEELKLAYKAIRCFNPFRNRYSCFYDESLKQIVTKFKKRLNWDCLFTVSDKLKAATNLLNYPILLTWLKDKEVKTRVFPRGCDNVQNPITLFASQIFIDDDTQNTGTVYNFMLNDQLCLKLKNSALLYFLRQTVIPMKQIRKVLSVVKNKEHFLISLIKSDFHKVISDIYKSPYIVSKLADAGFETDPRSAGPGELSTFYYALISGNTKIIYELYYFAANSCFESEESYRNPDSLIISNLLQIKNILLNDLSKTNSFEGCERRDEIKKSYDHLFQLNKYLVEIYSNLLKIKKEINYYESVSDDIFEASKRRDAIVAILAAYEKFFKTNREKPSTLSLLEDYITHKNYYDSVDMTTAISFFDNIVYLKERLSLGNTNDFSEIESCFYMSVLLHISFDKMDLKQLSKVIPLQNINSVYAIPLINRIKSFNKIETFSKILENTVITKDNIVECIPSHEIYNILNSYPEIKDDLEMQRLKQYINTALKVKVINIESVLVLERVLQVIGDFITPEPNNDLSFRHLSLMYLPKETAHILHRIRHEISHLKGYTFPSKFETEKNYSLFKSIQKDIQFIKLYFKPIFQIHLFRVTIYMISLFEEAIRQISSISKNDLLYPFHSNEELIQACKLLPNICFGEVIMHFLSVFESVLNKLDEDITNEIFRKNMPEDPVNSIQIALRHLQYLLELTPQFSTYRDDNLLKMLDTIKSCESFIDRKENIGHFIDKCRAYISRFNIASKKKNIRTIENSAKFLKILKGFTYLSEEDKNAIRREIPQSMKDSVSLKDELILSIDEGFTFNSRGQEFKLPYLSKTKMDLLKKFYKSENLKALNILQTQDPISELEDVFAKNCVNKKNYESLCEQMQFSEDTKKKLGRLVAGQSKKMIPTNNLSNLLNRIQLLKNILIEKNKEIFELWTKTKSEKARQYVVAKIVRRYLKVREVQASCEMLLTDCMILFENEKIENPWIKSSKLYSGIRLRNVICHGSPLLENLCTLFDPEDLPTELVQKMLRLVEDEDAVVAILELYECVDCDFTRVQKIIQSDEKDEYDPLRNRIRKRKNDGWKEYTLLLPYAPPSSNN